MEQGRPSGSPGPTDSMREVGLIAAILLGVVLSIGAIWMYQEKPAAKSRQSQGQGPTVRATPRAVVPDTIPGAQPVTATVAPAPERVAPRSGAFDIQFELDGAGLTSEAKRALDGHLRIMKQQDGVTVLLHGFADVRGSVEYNRALGQRRARAVEAYLLEHGIPGGAIQVFSRGENDALCEEPVEACHQRNRRVHVKWRAGAETSAAKTPADTAGPQEAPAPAGAALQASRVQP